MAIGMRFSLKKSVDEKLKDSNYEVTDDVLKDIKITIDTNDDWFKKFQTLTLAGNGAALALLLTSFKSTPEISAINQSRDHIELFVPFTLGVMLSAIATFWAARINGIIRHKNNHFDMMKEGGPLDELFEEDLQRMVSAYSPTLSEEHLRKTLEETKSKGKKETNKLINELNRRQIRDSQNVFIALNASSILFVLGLINIGFGNHLNSFVKWLWNLIC